MKCEKCEKYRDMLFEVVDELSLSHGAIKKHGPMGTRPAELVKAVLRQKDLEIKGLKIRALIIKI